MPPYRNRSSTFTAQASPKGLEICPQLLYTSKSKHHRGVAQLIARSVWDREVEGLSPFTPTILRMFQPLDKETSSEVERESLAFLRGILFFLRVSSGRLPRRRLRNPAWKGHTATPSADRWDRPTRRYDPGRLRRTHFTRSPLRPTVDRMTSQSSPPRATKRRARTGVSSPAGSSLYRGTPSVYVRVVPATNYRWFQRRPRGLRARTRRAGEWLTRRPRQRRLGCPLPGVLWSGRPTSRRCYPLGMP
jgi:hypothetical protein